MFRVLRISGARVAGPSCWHSQIHLKWPSAQRSRRMTGQGGGLCMRVAQPSLPLTPRMAARFPHRLTTLSSSLVMLPHLEMAAHVEHSLPFIFVASWPSCIVPLFQFMHFHF